MDKLFQFCQKIVVFSEDDTRVLLAKRKGEADYDGTYSFIGGKMEVADGGFVEGMRREKNEEVGEDVRLKIYPSCSYNAFFVKKDNNSMVLPHYYAQYLSGEIKLNEEYSDYKWVPIDEIEAFEPKIGTIPEAIKKTSQLKGTASESELVII